MSDLRPILYAEDDDNDAFLMRRAFRLAGIESPLVVVRNGLEAIQYLSREDGYSNPEKYPFPRLVLLDIKMPLRSGFEVLAWTRSSQKPDLPILILTSSNQATDIERAYQEGANAFLVKPGNPAQLVDILKGIKKLWLR